jgi:hypothetical protein
MLYRRRTEKGKKSDSIKIKDVEQAITKLLYQHAKI